MPRPPWDEHPDFSMARSVSARRKSKPAKARTRAMSRNKLDAPKRAPDVAAGRGRTPARAPSAPAPYRAWPALKSGDRVALFSPSSHQGRTPPDSIARARDVLLNWGLRPDGPGPERRHLYLAGTDQERAWEFQRLYLDRSVKGMFCTRGGYGAARMLSLLDRKRIAAAPPKPVVGFSDATALFAWLHWAAGISVVHGPSLAAPSALTAPDAEISLEALRHVLFNPAARPEYSTTVIYKPGKLDSFTARGRLLGGNLSVLVTTLGTEWSIDTRGAILFLEDTGEAPYRIDRMLTHLRTAGKFDAVRAVVFGHLQRCDGDPPGLLLEVLRDVFQGAPFPVTVGLAAGHGEPNFPLLLGRQARLELSPQGTGGEAHLSML